MIAMMNAEIHFGVYNNREQSWRQEAEGFGRLRQRGAGKGEVALTIL